MYLQCDSQRKDRTGEMEQTESAENAELSNNFKAQHLRDYLAISNDLRTEVI